VFLTIFGVKKVSLKRSDDAVKKEEAKAWVEEKKRKRAEKHGKHIDSEPDHETTPESPSTASTHTRRPSS
jgi:hypothetical protein